MGHYARWIRKGAVLLTSASSDVPPAPEAADAWTFAVAASSVTSVSAVLRAPASLAPPPVRARSGIAQDEVSADGRSRGRDAGALPLFRVPSRGIRESPRAGK